MNPRSSFSLRQPYTTPLIYSLRLRNVISGEMASTNWTSGTREGLVTVRDYALYLRAAGPDGEPGRPPVVCISGMADSSATWVALQKRVSTFARIYSYDRTGLGRSDLKPGFATEDKAYREIAAELRDLLKAAAINPPVVLVMHSMGGLIGREFLDLYSKDVAGMVFIDTITEHNHEHRPKEIPRILHGFSTRLDPSYLWSVYEVELTEDELKDALGNVDHVGETESDSMKKRRDDQDKAAFAEVQNLIPSSLALAEKRQFESTPMARKPVSVIKGDSPGEWRYVFDQAVMAGWPTAEERKILEDYLAGAEKTLTWLQSQQLRLSDNSHMVLARKSWHNVHWYEPDLVAKEIQWCLAECAMLVDSD